MPVKLRFKPKTYYFTAPFNHKPNVFMNFCSNCGSKNIALAVPENDNRERFICPDCNQIFYDNPRIIVGCLITDPEKGILLAKRAIDPCAGLWNLPAGFLENKETAEEGAIRETLEETNTEVEMGELYAIFNVPQINQVYMLYLAKVIKDDFSATTESLEVEFFNEANIPWEELAFPFVPIALKNVFADMKKNEFPLTTHTIERRK